MNATYYETMKTMTWDSLAKTGGNIPGTINDTAVVFNEKEDGLL